MLSKLLKTASALGLLLSMTAFVEGQRPVRCGRVYHTPINTKKLVSLGVLNARAIKLVKPPYPLTAVAVGATDEVHVEVIINENGCVIKATPRSGHIFFRSASVKAARQSTFEPVYVGGKRVRVFGLIVYRFKR